MDAKAKILGGQGKPPTETDAGEATDGGQGGLQQTQGALGTGPPTRMSEHGRVTQNPTKGPPIPNNATPLNIRRMRWQE